MRSPARPTTTRVVAALVAALVAAVLSGCSEDEPARDPAARLAEATRQLDTTSGVRLSLAADKLPDDVSGLLAARGVGTRQPAFEGTLTVSSGGSQLDVEVVAVDGLVYAQLPFTADFVEVSPAAYNTPDPADLMAPRTGLSSIVAAATKVSPGRQARSGEVVVTEFSAAVPGEAVAAIVPSAEPSADFEATFALTEGDRLERMRLTGPFYPGSEDVTYTIRFQEYGLDADITAP